MVMDFDADNERKYRQAPNEDKLFSLYERIEELQQQVDRLTSRGIEDLHHENANLKATIERVCGVKQYYVGIKGSASAILVVFVTDLKAAIKGESDEQQK
jgi:hypothetical protein